MFKRMSKPLLFTAAVLAVGLACSLTSSSPGSNSNEPPAANAETEGASQTGSGTTTDSSGAAADASTSTGGNTGATAGSGSQVAADTSRPVPLVQGLSGLNSYRLATSIRSTGPTSFDRNDLDMLTDYSSDLDARYARTRTVTSSEEDPEVTEDVTEQYQVGNESCDFSGGEWEYTAMTPVEREVTELFQSVIDFMPVIENPTFVDSVNLNGVMTDHYQFHISGLGAQSGALVTQSDGEYWVAQDGNYLVKYQLVMELRSGPEGDATAESAQGEFHIELTEINQPIAISLPADCLAVRDQQ